MDFLDGINGLLTYSLSAQPPGKTEKGQNFRFCYDNPNVILVFSSCFSFSIFSFFLFKLLFHYHCSGLSVHGLDLILLFFLCFSYRHLQYEHTCFSVAIFKLKSGELDWVSLKYRCSCKYIINSPWEVSVLNFPPAFCYHVLTDISGYNKRLLQCLIIG